MIVMNNNTKTDSFEHPYIEMFRKEIDSYCTYKEWAEEANDEWLERAFEEMMEDEFLHAHFLHEYLMDNNLYTPTNEDVHEQKFWKIRNKYFR
jgi:rubrerythrin